MIPHINNRKYLFFYFFIFLFFYSSCNSKKDSKKEEVIEVDFEQKREGKWRLAKSAKSGTWEKDVEYAYSKEQFKKRYVKTEVSFSKDYIIIGNDPYCSGNNILIKESLNFNLNGTDEDRKNLKLFLKEKFGLKENDFKGLYNLNCKHPFNKILDFGDKLLVREWGVYYYLFEKQQETKKESTSTKDYNCKEIDTKNIYEEQLYKICECDYDFSKCYSIFYDNSDDSYKKRLLKNLPKEDVKPSSGFTGTYYKFYKKDSLKITIQEDGGASYYLFKKVKNKTIIEFSADLP